MDKDVNTLLVFDLCYYSNATGDYLNQHKEKYIGVSIQIGSKCGVTCFEEWFGMLATDRAFLISLPER